MPTTEFLYLSTKENNNRQFQVMDCDILFSTEDTCEKQVVVPFEWLKEKLRKKEFFLIGMLSKIAGQKKYTFDNSSMQKMGLYEPIFLKYYHRKNKLFISDHRNYIIRSMKNISMDNQKTSKWNGELKIEVGQPRKEGYSNGDINTCTLEYPSGFDWDSNGNMYICNLSSICKVDNKSNQVSLVAGYTRRRGYRDGNNDEAMFDFLRGILCYEENEHSSPVLYACDVCNKCVRRIDIQNGKTSTYAGKGTQPGDIDGTLQDAMLRYPWDIIKDNEDQNILYVSDGDNNKIRTIDMENGMVSTLVGDIKDKSILHNPRQMQAIHSFIYLTCLDFGDCIVRVHKKTKQVTKIKYKYGVKYIGFMSGITYHPVDRCFYLSSMYDIYKLE